MFKVWFGLVRCGVVRYGKVGSGKARNKYHHIHPIYVLVESGAVRHGLARRSKVWYGTVRRGKEQINKIAFIKSCLRSGQVRYCIAGQGQVL